MRKRSHIRLPFCLQKRYSGVSSSSHTHTHTHPHITHTPHTQVMLNVWPVPRFSSLVRSGIPFHWWNMPFGTWLSESDSLQRGFAWNNHMCLENHHHTSFCSCRAPRKHSVWMGSLYFKLMGVQRPEWGLFSGLQPWLSMRITWGAFKKILVQDLNPNQLNQNC